MRSWLWVLLAALWLAGNHFLPLLDPDEGRYAEIPREMAASGDWLTPRLNDLKYFEKPPLQYWATAALYEVFGVNSWSARAWTLLLSFLCMPLTFAWVRRFYGTPAASAALAVLATSPLFLLIGHLNLLDGAFTFWLSATVFGFATAQMQTPGARAERNWMLLTWAMAALAVLSKGIVVPVLAGLTLVAYSLIERNWRPWTRLHLVYGLPLFLVIVAPWFVLVQQSNPEFARFFFLHEHFERFLTTVHEHGEPWWFFLPILGLSLLPWLGMAIPAMRLAWQDNATGENFRPLRFLAIYAAVVLGFFSLSQSKLPSYILPMLPPLAAIFGAQIVRQSKRFLRPVAWISCGMVIFVALGLVIYALRRYHSAPPQLLGWTLAAVIAAAALALAGRKQELPRWNSVVLAASLIVAWQCLLAAYSVPPMMRSTAGLLDVVRPLVNERSQLFSVGQYRPSASVYLGRTVTLVDYRGELDFGMQQEPGRNTASRDQFITAWRASRDAIAFIHPNVWRALGSHDFPGRVLGSDRYSIVVSRQ
jgi:4-amino-4-deoxy-L-arabinose transferase-like glycosyltransferase